MYQEKDLSIHTRLPEGVMLDLAIAGCFLTYKDKVLLLKRHPEKLQGERWGLPAGRLEKDEQPIEGALRELFEEAGILLNKAEMLSLGTLYILRNDINFAFHIFYKKLQSVPRIDLKLDENIEFQWIDLQEGQKLPLITGGGFVLSYCFDAASSLEKNR